MRGYILKCGQIRTWLIPMTVSSRTGRGEQQIRYHLHHKKLINLIDKQQICRALEAHLPTLSL